MYITNQSLDLTLNIWQKTSNPFTTTANALSSAISPSHPASWDVDPVQVMMAGPKPYVMSMISASRSWNWWAACVKRNVCCLHQALLMLADLTSLSVIQKPRWDLPVLWNAGAPFLVRISWQNAQVATLSHSFLWSLTRVIVTWLVRPRTLSQRATVSMDRTYGYVPKVMWVRLNPPVFNNLAVVNLNLR